MGLPDLRGPRLRLVAAGTQDVEFFAELNGDPLVMQYVSGRSLTRAETAEEWAARLGPRSAHELSLGYWTGFTGDNPVGWWGLGFHGEHHGAGELGFRLSREWWRQGLGVEGARLVVGHGFTSSSISRVWAGTTTANEASRATLAKVGLRCTASPRAGVLTYELAREEWVRASMHRGYGEAGEPSPPR